MLFPVNFLPPVAEIIGDFSGGSGHRIYLPPAEGGGDARIPEVSPRHIELTLRPSTSGLSMAILGTAGTAAPLDASDAAVAAPASGSPAASE